MAAMVYPAGNVYVTNVTSTSTDATWGMIRITGSNCDSTFTPTGDSAEFISNDGKWYSDRISRDRRNNVVWDRRHWAQASKLPAKNYRESTINLCSPIVNLKSTQSAMSPSQRNHQKRKQYVQRLRRVQSC
jgi:hypothetical protein